MPPSPVLCRQSASAAPRLRASTALPDSDPEAHRGDVDHGFRPECSRAAPRGTEYLGAGQLDLVRGHRRRRRCRPAEGAMLDHRIAGRVLQVVVGAESEVVVRLFRRRVHPPTLVAGERALLVVGRDDVLPQLGADSFDQVSSMPDEGEVAQQRVLALQQVTHDDSPQRRGGRGGETAYSPAHVVSVSPPTPPETDSMTAPWWQPRSETASSEPPAYSGPRSFAGNRC
jgi:hypothetical protein